ncbi:MAG: S8 family serine peptidase [Thermoplasmata archaeon]
MKGISAIVSLVLVFMICTSLVFSSYVVEDTSVEIVLVVHEGNLSLLDGMNVLDIYGRYAVVEVDSESPLNGLTVYRRPGLISLNGRMLDISTLTMEAAENGDSQEGLYILSTPGPANPKWRSELESLGVQVIRYIPDHSYLVWMEHGMYDEIAGLFYVSYTAHHPWEYKIGPDVTPGNLLLDVVPGYEYTTAERIGTMSSTDNIRILPYTNRISADVDDMNTVRFIARLEEVILIYPQMEPQLGSELESQLVGGYWNSDSPSSPYREYGDHGAFVNQIGYTGEGVVVGLVDTGLGDGTPGNAGHPDFTGRVIGGHAFAGDGNWADGNGHGTHCTGSMAGDAYGGTGTVYAGHGPYYVSQGLAYGSDIFPQKVFTDEGTWVGPDEDYEILRNAKVEGDVYVHSNSWSYGGNGVYFTIDSDYDRAARDSDPGGWGHDGMVITAAAGNGGPSLRTIGSPGNGKNVIAVGATGTYMPDATSYGNSVNTEEPYSVVDFSSRGWTEDSRVKPDIVAPGRAILSTSSPLVSSGNIYSHDNRYEWMSGTSMATPLVAGGAAVVVDYYEDVYGTRPSPAMVKALMINSATDLDIASIPNRREGWGLLNLPDIVDPRTSVMLGDQESLLTTGDTHEFQIQVDSMNEPLKITLVWTDKYASTYANPSLLNDLNLEVVAPGGDTYRGNAFSDSWTPQNTDAMGAFDSNGDGWDDRNTAENVYIHKDDLESGTYTVKIIGHNIPEDALLDGNPSQDYALVMQNSKPYTPSLRTDRDIYSTEDTIQISVDDITYDGHGGIDVTAYSDTDPVGVDLQLTPHINTWRFSGSLTISQDSSPDALLVSHGDEVTVEHDTIQKTVYVDGVGPSVEGIDVITGLAVYMEWTTDKPVWSRIDYTGLGQEGTAYSNEFGTQHSTVFQGLVPGGTYSYHVYSTDLADNVDRDITRSFTVSTTDDVEDGNMGWTPDSRWGVRDLAANSGDYSWNCGDGNYGTRWDEKLVTPKIDTSLWLNATLSWWHNYEFDYGEDGGLVEVFHEGSWVQLTPVDGYDAVLYGSDENVIGGRAAFTGASDGWILSEADLTPYVGSEELRIRFWVGTDDYANYPDPLEGWHIDDIEITGTGITPPDIDMIQPNGGEILNYGTDHEISWTTTPGTNPVDHVALWYSLNDGDSWYHIKDVDDTGSYLWNVPNVHSDRSLVKAIVYDGDGFTGTDVSDGTFTIIGSTHPSITLTVPGGGEVWYTDTDENIQWVAAPGDSPISGIDIAFSTDSGSTWTTIVNGAANTGSHTWSVPDVNTENARVRVIAHDDLGVSETDTSGNFQIVGIPASPPRDLDVEHYGVLEEHVVHTRYMRGIEDEETVNGLSAYSLGTTQSDNEVVAPSLGNNQDIYAGIRVWVRSDAGIESELTAGSAVGIAYRAGGTDEGMISGNTWSPPPDTELSTTDSVVIRLYQGTESPPTDEVGVFTTERLGAIRLLEGPWTPHYFLRSRGLIGRTRVLWGTDIYNTRLENFGYILPIEGDDTEDNRLSWNASTDDPGKVTSYNLYRSSSSTGPWTFIESVMADGSTTYQYVDSGKGTADDTLWWYTVYSDWDGYEGEGTPPVREPTEAPMDTFDIPLFSSPSGWNFISFNLELADTSLSSILEDIEGSYDRVMYYNAHSDRWNSYVPGRAEHFNNLHSWDHTMGVWIRVTEDNTLTVEGYAPETTLITLYPGWNMVGVPSESGGNHGLPGEVTVIGYFDSSQPNDIAYDHNPGQFVFEQGNGYWVYNDASYAVDWMVDY